MDSYLHNEYFLYYPNKYIYHEFYFNRYEVSTDYGDLNKRERIDDALGIQYFKESSVTMQDFYSESNFKNPDRLADYTFYKGLLLFNNKKTYYSRWYQKIPDIIAQTWAIIRVIHILIYFVFSFYFKYNFSADLVKKKLFYEDEAEIVKNNLRNYYEFNRNSNNYSNIINKEREKVRLSKSFSAFNSSKRFQCNKMGSKNETIEIKKFMGIMKLAI